MTGPAGLTGEVPVGLAIDLGRTSVGVIAVTDRGAWLVPDPTSGENRWRACLHWDGRQVVVGALAEHRRRVDPTGYAAGFARDLANDAPVLLGARRFRAVEQTADLLSVIRAEAQRRHGLLDRAVLTIPADYLPGDPRRARLVGAAEAAGFRAVELLAEAVAVVSAPLPGPPLADGDHVLIYDLGADRGLGADTLAEDRGGGSGSRYGADFDVTLVRIGADFHDVIGHARLADISVHATGTIEQTYGCCLDLLASAGLGPHELAAVIPVGAGCRAPGLEATLEHALGAPVRRLDAPELAVVSGAAYWLPRTSPRTVVAAVSPDRLVPLTFTIPGGSARLLRWLVTPAEPYEEGSALARVRLANGAVWDLTARTRGTVEQLLVADGAQVDAGEWLALSRG